MRPHTPFAALALALVCAACARKPEPPVQHPAAHADTVAVITRYEVAPYTLGPTTANVRWSELEGIVRPAYLPH